jgi:hypothetical protein
MVGLKLPFLSLWNVPNSITLAIPFRYDLMQSLSRQKVYSLSYILKFGIFPSTVSLNGTIFFFAAIPEDFFTGDFVRLFGGSNLRP